MREERVNKIKAVIFDMDGVLVDSMPYHYLAWYEALRPYGIRVSCFEVFAKEGERWEKTLTALLRREGIKPTPDILRKIFLRRKRIFRRYFKRYLFENVKQFIYCLKKKGYRLGLVTGTPTQELTRILPKRLRKMFDVIVAGDHVKKGKPHPEPYLMAIHKLALLPKEAVVIENAPFGIKSAKRAGIFCIGLTTSLPRQYLSEADKIVERIEDIPPIIERSC
ncbi:MAG: HAD family phosphatase [Candidatus Omnitrophica bacterium]|nr:HAD family phosphatase [Candidatus Omnitrophota bacterium]